MHSILSSTMSINIVEFQINKISTDSKYLKKKLVPPTGVPTTENLKIKTPALLMITVSHLCLIF